MMGKRKAPAAKRLSAKRKDKAMNERKPYPDSVPVIDHRQCDILPYYVRLRVLRRDGTEGVDLFDTFDAATCWLQGRLEEEDHYEDIQAVMLECISGAHVRPKEEGEDDA
ncbi:MAG: hypothetical protein JXB13_08235 [Phycisphaerae bacterium]|nr:hypothetical protein [Phycisphaerae bacterium]